MQTDDVIMNVLGGMVGYTFWQLVFGRRKNNIKNTTLLIMAAGIGSRFGGIKQLEPVGLHNEIIMDYSIHDAIEAGFNKIISLSGRILKRILRSESETEWKISARDLVWKSYTAFRISIKFRERSRLAVRSPGEPDRLYWQRKTLSTSRLL